MKVWRFAFGLGAVVLAMVATVYATQASASSTQTVTAQTIAIHHSHYDQKVITVRAGEPVTFTLQNDDPIEHEWIVGTKEVHQRHRLGTEPYHDQIPTEVTIPALTTKFTTVTFDKPGSYAFICHLPGHEAYGMKGTVKVVS